ERLGEVVAVAVVVKDDCELTERTIKTYCARNLADFQQPHKIFFVDMLPKNAMGKLQRNRILEHIKNVGLDK
ncbi:MAG: long-chain fatty acid--CoA ligase, partial [Bacteroidaceae bacterium]|nr:long-chain fatty acid--CoA ligase [Bacteroidaceae bacterium]